MTYYVHETTTYAGIDLSTIGITVDNSVTPKALLVDTTIAAQTLYMEWWAEPEVPQTTILYFAFTITITEPCDPNSIVLGS